MSTDMEYESKWRIDSAALLPNFRLSRGCRRGVVKTRVGMAERCVLHAGRQQLGMVQRRGSIGERRVPAFDEPEAGSVANRQRSANGDTAICLIYAGPTLQLSTATSRVSGAHSQYLTTFRARLPRSIR